MSYSGKGFFGVRERLSVAIPVVDVFAGPGGLNEGFSSVNDGGAFETVLSIEMEDSAIATLRLRATVRGIRKSGNSSAVTQLKKFLNKELALHEFYKHEAVAPHHLHAEFEVQQFKLSEDSRAKSDALIRERLTDGSGEIPGQWVLIGGPPCQAYSLAGRSRRTNDETFEDDHKHFLFKEYLHIIEEFRPSVFVMENVKGMLSSKNKGQHIFELLQHDLENFPNGVKYNLHSMVVDTGLLAVAPQDFLIRSEDYGIPQKRHRVIIVGVRSDLGGARPETLTPVPRISVRDAIADLPRLRSGVSKPRDPEGILWDDIWSRYHNEVKHRPSVTRLEEYLNAAGAKPRNEAAAELRAWLIEHKPAKLWNHEARSHMVSDLHRYTQLASRAQAAPYNSTSSPKVRELDKKYWPQHKNFTQENAPFADRFRVQVWDAPSTTVVSHIAKDGHYYIHPDPAQMRSLTVREAARLQTFPDDYIFLGNRTQQYTQVGNAVPPLLARQIGESIAQMLQEVVASSDCEQAASETQADETVNLVPDQGKRIEI